MLVAVCRGAGALLKSSYHRSRPNPQLVLEPKTSLAAFVEVAVLEVAVEVDVEVAVEKQCQGNILIVGEANLQCTVAGIGMIECMEEMVIFQSEMEIGRNPIFPFSETKFPKYPNRRFPTPIVITSVQKETEESVNKDETKEEIKQEENPKDDVLEEVQQMVANLKILNTTIDNLSKKINSNQHQQSNVNYHMSHYFNGSRFVMPHPNYGYHHRTVYHPQYGTTNHFGQYGNRH
ncbi:hypothetical protein GCK72_015315 [Caenorhabditis remanei]|uniref:Uncharacterized protein n=1 Tax=Caenorhabditis remanei TaxID=31234 RepID=A0A6A5GWI5_CAERE|nr:hypothetical protein GCK72_015315 [Caenorhabditis remanei]KAF1758855.1 hypothetical protein GCK72_015315 [Caenorhabditis remanei]